MSKKNLAIVGASGLVGQTFLKVIEKRDFPFDELYLFTSKRSAGQKILYKGKEYEYILLDEENIKSKKIDIALFSAGGDVSKEYAPIFAKYKAIVVDNSSCWRMDEDVPLIVPEVNPADINKIKKGIIANPNCSTIQAMLPLKAVHDKYKIKRIIFSTYQAVSGSGLKGIKDLENGIKGENQELLAYPHPIFNNALPQIDVFLDNDYTKEEMKMVNETKKILGDDELKITATTVRIPVFNSHSESINVETKLPFEISDIKKIISEFPNTVLVDDPKKQLYPLASEASGKDEVFVGRIRRDDSAENAFNMFVVADNIRKGAATNTVQIAELLK